MGCAARGADLLIAALFPDLDPWIRLTLGVMIVTAIVTRYDIVREKREQAER
jgi:hypothetical protein